MWTHRITGRSNGRLASLAAVDRHRVRRMEAMKLEQFVEEALTQLMRGVHAAQKKAVEFGATINPCPDAVYGDRQWTSHNQLPIVDVAFDVALTSESGDSKKGGIGVFLGALAAGGEVDKKASHGSISRIQFTVPVVFPQGGEPSGQEIV